MGVPYMRSSALACVRDFIQRSGGDAQALFDEVGLTYNPEEADEKFCSFHKALALYEIAAQSLNKPDFGLELALTLPPEFAHFSPFVYLGHFEKNARRWFHSAVQFQSMFTNGHRPELIEDAGGGQAIIRMHTDFPFAPPRQWREFQMAGITLLVQSLLKTPLAKADVTRLQHARPDNITLHRRVFGNDIEFCAEHDEFVFDSSLLDYRLNGRASLLRPLITLYMGQQVRHVPRIDLSTAGHVKLYLQCVLGMGRGTLKDTALAMSMNEKALQRLLANEGTSFSEILDGLRRRKAMMLLRTGDLKVRQVASMLDYSATPAFTLAFKRWTGMSPEAYRTRLVETGEMEEPLVD